MINSDSLTYYEKQQLNDYAGFLSRIPTWDFVQFINRPEKLVALFYGNQKGKTDDVATSYVMRILGIHPIEKKNIRPSDKVRTLRFASETLPNDPEGGEVVNTQYPFFKKRLPAFLIKRDITHRRPVMTIRDPQGGDDIFVEFVSYQQSVQRQAGVPRKSIWFDESAPLGFYEEQIPRLMTSGGDIVYTLTPAEGVNWEFDKIYERADIFIKTKYVVDRIFETTGKRVPRIETTGSKNDIAVLQAGSDDNPTLTKEAVDEVMDLLGATDEELIDIRRYGLFRAISGQIFKDFDMRTHKISGEKYFPDSLPHSWKHGRFIDYHEHNPWAIVFLALSPDDEAFVWKEYNPSPEKFVTLEIAKHVASISGDYKFLMNKIDPTAATKQSNTGLSVVDDLNRLFYEFRREGLGTGGYWTSWDTKSTRGRDEIRKRLKNARLVGKPFNNVIVKNGRTEKIPTLWILDDCVQTLSSLKSWRKEEWANRESLVTKDEKDKPQQKWSHFCMCLEAAFKEYPFSINSSYKETTHKKYFEGR